MNGLKRYGLPLLDRFSRALPLSALIRTTGQKLFLPYYHVISDASVPHVQHLYPVRTVKQFEEDLEFLLKHFEPVGIDELADIAKGRKRLTANSFFLSFDDGLREVYEVMCPLLEKRGIPAAIFVNSAFADNKDLFYRYKASILINALLKEASNEEQLKQASRLLQVNYQSREVLDMLAKPFGVDYQEYLQKEKPYMTTTQLLELKNKGFHIGAHSVDHPKYADIPLEEQLAQTIESIRWLKEKGLQSTTSFAFPFTDHGVSRKFFDTVLDEKAPVAELSFGGAGLKKDISDRHFQRFPMEGTLKDASRLIATEYLYYLLKMPLGRNRIKRI